MSDVENAPEPKAEEAGGEMPDTEPGVGIARAAEQDPAPASLNLQMVMDIPVTLSIEMGRTKMNINELLQLNPGSVVELERTVDQPMDVLVNGKLVAHGEVVVIDDRFGLRLTDVASPSERVKQLR